MSRRVGRSWLAGRAPAPLNSGATERAGAGRVAGAAVPALTLVVPPPESGVSAAAEFGPDFRQARVVGPVLERSGGDDERLIVPAKLCTQQSKISTESDDPRFRLERATQQLQRHPLFTGLPSEQPFEMEHVGSERPLVGTGRRSDEGVDLGGVDPVLRTVAGLRR